MARVVVSVMPKPEILDPQGKAVHGALPRLGFHRRHRRAPGQAVRARGRRRGDDAVLAEIHELAGTLLSNPVIEDFAVEVDGTAVDEAVGA